MESANDTGGSSQSRVLTALNWSQYGFQWSSRGLVQWWVRPLGLLRFQEEISWETGACPLPPLTSPVTAICCGYRDGAAQLPAGFQPSQCTSNPEVGNTLQPSETSQKIYGDS